MSYKIVLLAFKSVELIIMITLIIASFVVYFPKITGLITFS